MLLRAVRLQVFITRRDWVFSPLTLWVACSLWLCAAAPMQLRAAPGPDLQTAKTTHPKRRATPRKIPKRLRPDAPRRADARAAWKPKPARSTHRITKRRPAARIEKRPATPKYFDGGSLARRSPPPSAMRAPTHKTVASIHNTRTPDLKSTRKKQPHPVIRSTLSLHRWQEPPGAVASKPPPGVVRARAVSASQAQRKRRRTTSQSTLATTARAPQATRPIRLERTRRRAKDDVATSQSAVKRPIVGTPLKPRPVRARRWEDQRRITTQKTQARQPHPRATKTVAVSNQRDSPRSKIKIARPVVVPRQAATIFTAPVANGAAPDTARNPDTVGRVANVAGWRAELLGEEPTGIYWDRQTLLTRTSILFSLRLQNTQSLTRSAIILWRVLDLDGREVWRREGRFVVGARRLLHRRELFEAPARGAYLLRVAVRSASQKRAGDASVALPFALSMAPTPGFRPRSFFGLNTSSLLSRDELSFYARIGARVLRSPWLPANARESIALDEELRARLERNLATVGVLHPFAAPCDVKASVVPVASPGGTTSAVAEWSWARQVLAPMTRWPLVSRWEIGGFAPSSRRADFGQVVQNLPQANAVAFDFSDEAAFDPSLTTPDARWAMSDRWPAFGGAHAVSLHPVAAQLMLACRREIAHRPLHIVDDATSWNRPRQSGNGAETMQTGVWATRYLTGVMTGAASFSSALEDEANASPAQSTLQRVAYQSDRDGAALSDELRRFARAAAFSTMTRLLEDTAFEGDLFASSPVLCGALFRGRNENVLAIWMAPQQDGQAARGRLKLRIPMEASGPALPVRVLDLFGNEQASATGRDLSIAVGPEPVYIATARPLEALRAASRDAALTQSDAVAVQLLPLSQGFPASFQALRVRVQNLAPQLIGGQVQIVSPPSWKLRADTESLRLEAGQTRILTFIATQTVASPEGAYPFEIIVRSTAGSLRRHQTLHVATAANWCPGQRVRVDGNLSEWRDAIWLSGDSIENLKPIDTPSIHQGKPLAPARMALRWDATRLYIAAKIIEPRLRVRRSGEVAFPFWRGCDALQLGFGVRDAMPGDAKYFDKAAIGAARDTDYGFLICPFGVTANGLIEGRVLRLWSPTLPFGARLDALRWGGVVPGSSCAVRRDERANVTSYEAAIPLSQIPELRPAARALPLESGVEITDTARLENLEKPVRFGWIAHDDTLLPRVWPAPSAALPWELGASSFLPVNQMFPVTTTTLGWTARGPLVSDATQTPGARKLRPTTTHAPSTPTLAPSRPAPAIIPSPAIIAPPPRPRPTAKPTARPTEATPSRRFSTPEVLPMPPSILPPAAPPPGQQIAPQLPS